MLILEKVYFKIMMSKRVINVEIINRGENNFFTYKICNMQNYIFYQFKAEVIDNSLDNIDMH